MCVWGGACVSRNMITNHLWKYKMKKNKMKPMCKENHLNEEQSEILTSSSIIESIAFKEDTQKGKSC